MTLVSLFLGKLIRGRLVGQTVDTTDAVGQALPLCPVLESLHQHLCGSLWLTIAMAQTLTPDESGFLVATLFSGLSVSRVLTLQVITLLNLPLKLGRKEQETPRESKHILFSPFLLSNIFTSF